MSTLPSSRDWLRAHPRGADALPAIGVFLLAVLVTDPDPDRAADARPLTVGTVLLVAATCALLVWRRDYPLPVLALTVLGAVTAILLIGERTLVALAPLVALFTVAVLGRRRTTWRAAIVTAVALMAAEWLYRGAFGFEVLNGLAFTAAAASAGDALGHRRAYLTAMEERAVRAEQGREQESRRRVAEERLRIARELHDVVAHNMAVVNVQAGVAEYLLPDHPAQAQEALGHVRRAAGGILTELGDILNVLRQDDERTDPTTPAPGLARIEDLITSFAAAGLVVDWSLSGQPRPLGGGVDLVAYRMVQEALTNAHKHGTGTAHLAVSYLPDEVHLQVTNPLPFDAEQPDGAQDPSGRGHGLLGIQERATAVGGAVRVGAAGGQFEVHAVLPTPASS